MARVKINRGDPRNRLAFFREPPMDVVVETPNCTYGAHNMQSLLEPSVSMTIEDQTSGQERVKGTRSGRPKRGSTV